ncbi:efflux transporter outer membrane subunit [Asticcacaulis excentricus]|uniref:RND efflux system, outer membrane lipoprotein, NodT family n=1 Tax=Asticcacaulis excentricus (strain ATCC 15261 / DSM 4724 / KCTC 12464 / NCIMB 9791 / VKM B-1370 / CB 48) TaxID=573065 RepID=E8RU41_ASTEC|nr:efflux transporter outer membrane subunit [Asticcacaulis excentricus]ADU15012.1 RND efflux system, outer membrane lipoprotein, NodT family [Asticcacaulis excentricus CB 48]
MKSSFKLGLMLPATALVLSACTLAPKYERGTLPVADQFPTPATAQGESAETLPWQKVFLDPRLQSVIYEALVNNRDLRIATLNAERVRAQYSVQRASLFPSVNGTVSGRRGDTGTGTDTESYSADIGASWELDLFGRVRSLSNAALNTYFASAENQKAAKLSLISSVATAWLTLGADQEQLRLSRETLRLREESLSLTQKRFDLGATDALGLRQEQTLTEQARADVAQLEALVQQDKNALRLLVGVEVEAANLPNALPENAVLSDLPVGLPSEVLLKRPDVVAAEFDLKAANANIGAARAAFFPRISLTGAVGKASTDLNNLFDGADTWSFAPSISVPIFAGGANIAGLESSKKARDIALATYEKSIQTAFRDVADALAVRSTIDTRLTAQTRVVQAASETEALSRARFDRGVDSRLTLTDAQRTLYGAQQGLITTRLTRALNLTRLYAATGGGLQ